MAENETTKGTPLHLAVADGDTEQVRTLLAAGADPVAENESGQTPLHQAFDADRVEIVQMLLATDAYRWHLDDALKAKLLCLAARTGTTETIKRLTMPDIRVAWYSEEQRDVYHLCQNCHYNDDILPENLVAGTEHQIVNELLCENPDTSKRDLLCQNCKALLKDWKGIVLLIPTS